MTWGGKKDDEKAAAAAEKTASDTAANPPQHARQAPLLPNRETANEPDQQINPHNTALGQRPVEGAEKKINEAETWLRDTHLGKLQEWKRRVFLGGPKSADWDEFDDFVDEGTMQERSRRSASR